jgi:hypothetical protein
MKNSILITAVVVSVLFLAGCSSGNTTSSSSTPYIGGTNGLLISFLDNSPPPQVPDNEQMPFNIVVVLENAGEANVAAGRASVRVTGIYPQDFGLTSADQLKNTNANEVTGIRKDAAGNRIQGSTEQVQIPAGTGTLNFKRLLTTGNLELPLFTTVCYTYSTTASGRYCLKANPNSNVGGVCEPSGAQQIFSSASPIQVDSLVQSYAGTSAVNINFKISKKGNGNIFAPTTDPTEPTCGLTPTSKVTDENKVEVSVTLPGAAETETVTCYGLTGATAGTTTKGTLRLDSQGTAMVSCKIINAAAVDAVREVKIDVKFDYSETRSSSLIIQHLLN